MSLYRGVQTVAFDTSDYAPEDVNTAAVQELVSRGVVQDGDLVILTKGDYVSAQGGTNSMKIVRVGAPIR